jgi:hypothetical protein
MSVIDDIETYCSAAAALIDAGDYAGATLKLDAARALIAGQPDLVVGGEQIRWSGRIEELASLVARAERKRASAGGIRSTRIRYKNPSDE